MSSYLRCSFLFKVPHVQTGEAGWLAGEINGHTGWFPESYVEKIEDGEFLPAEE